MTCPPTSRSQKSGRYKNGTRIIIGLFWIIDLIPIMDLLSVLKSRLAIDTRQERKTRQARAMPVIVMASPKGGVGKSTCAVLLAWEFACMGADVTVLDCDPNKSLTRWAPHGAPNGVTSTSGRCSGRVTNEPVFRGARRRAFRRDQKTDAVEWCQPFRGGLDHSECGRRRKIVIVDLEGVDSQMVSRAVFQ